MTPICRRCKREWRLPGGGMALRPRARLCPDCRRGHRLSVTIVTQTETREPVAQGWRPTPEQHARYVAWRDRYKKETKH